MPLQYQLQLNHDSPQQQQVRSNVDCQRSMHEPELVWTATPPNHQPRIGQARRTGRPIRKLTGEPTGCMSRGSRNLEGGQGHRKRIQIHPYRGTCEPRPLPRAVPPNKERPRGNMLQNVFFLVNDRVNLEIPGCTPKIVRWTPKVVV